jgi:N6-L-threonylcarbamoyladenine synthase
VAVLDADGRVEVNLLSSQVSAHAPYGGVVPELASREHLRALPLMARRAVETVGGALELVAVTTGPGLIGALLVGVRFAAAYAWGRGLPLVGVDHLEGHLVSPFLSLDGQPARHPPEPVLALVASGGHSAWFVITADGARRLSRTRDDAAGESLDKVAQAMGLPYPGGPVIDRLARQGDPGAVALPRPRLDRGDLDLSFSGLKSAAIRWIRDRSLTAIDEGTASVEVCDFLSSYEHAVVAQLLRPAPELIARHRPALLTASGGVAANTRLRLRLAELGRELGVEVLLPPLGLTTDNAAMIARAGQLAHERGRRTDPRRLDASAREVWQPPGMRRGIATTGEGRANLAEDPV